MRLLNFEQRSPEWHQARLGMPTASCFGKLITGTGKKSAQADAYINQLIAEKLTGKKEDGFFSDAMQRGIDLEPKARELYEFIRGEQALDVGLCLHDTIEAGCSPDGLMIDGGVEIKCPSPANHIEWLREGSLPGKHIPQVMGCIWITGAKWWDFVSYHEDIKPLIIRVERDEKYISLMEEIVMETCEAIMLNVEKLRK